MLFRSAITEPSLFTTTRMSVVVEDDGIVRGTPDDAATIDVVTDVDAEAAHTAFLRSLGCG